jgi:hypothetical protein
MMMMMLAMGGGFFVVVVEARLGNMDDSGGAVVCSAQQTYASDATYKARHVAAVDADFVDTTYYIKEVNDFKALSAGCNIIEGSVDIYCKSGTSGSTSVDIAAEEFLFFKDVTRITGYLRIKNCDLIDSLQFLRRLRSIEGGGITGSMLYSTTSTASIVLSIEFCTALTSLEGLHSIGYLGGNGKVYLDTLPNMCYINTVDWARLLGENYGPKLKISSVSSTCSDACSSECDTCDGRQYCWRGPQTSVEQRVPKLRYQYCNKYCEEEEDNTGLIVGLTVGLFFFVVILVVVYMMCTRRCGCRLTLHGRQFQVGVLPTSEQAGHDWVRAQAIDAKIKNVHETNRFLPPIKNPPAAPFGNTQV